MGQSLSNIKKNHANADSRRVQDLRGTLLGFLVSYTVYSRLFKNKKRVCCILETFSGVRSVLEDCQEHAKNQHSDTGISDHFAVTGIK